jgi:hypothetical protein
MVSLGVAFFFVSCEQTDEGEIGEDFADFGVCEDKLEEVLR